MRHEITVVLVVALAGLACNRPATPARPAGAEMSRAVLDPYLKIGAALASE